MIFDGLRQVLHLAMISRCQPVPTEVIENQAGGGIALGPPFNPSNSVGDIEAFENTEQELLVIRQEIHPADQFVRADARLILDALICHRRRDEQT
jgi:hypothetical protein